MIQPIEDVKAKCSLIGYEYVSGYEGSNGTLTLKCPKCGSYLIRKWRAVRKVASGYQKTFICKTCQEIEKAERKERHRLQLIENNKQLKEKRKKKKESDFWNQSFTQIKFTSCKNCGKPIWGHIYCSEGCLKAYNNKQRKDRRLRKIKNVKHIHIDIVRLYERDKGICYLCGGVCDFKDYTKDSKGTFIAGNNYPSIDHVVPLSLGGEHIWENVKLAHRICNSIKSNKKVGLTLPIENRKF